MQKEAPPKFMGFYDALPKHKAELVDGKLIIGGSLEKSAMMLSYMVEALGAKYVADLVPKDILQAAVIEAFGTGENITTLADCTPVKPSYYPSQQLASNIRMSFFRTDGLHVYGGKMAVKLGENVFMPDVYIYKSEDNDRVREYYFEGAPRLIIEVVTPYMREFDFGFRKDSYEQAGLPELWMLDYEKQTFTPFILVNGKFENAPIEGDTYHCQSIPEISVAHSRFFETAGKFGMSFMDDMFTIQAMPKGKNYFGEEMPLLPFAPRVDVEPVRLKFEEYISWGGEVKFEMSDGKPVFGGGYHTTAEWLGMLMMTLGMKETVKYLPAEEWSKVL